MAKGIRMTSCRKLNCGNKIFYLGQISKEDNGNLTCRFCPAKVKYVSSYTRKSSKIEVPAYLRLSKHEQHDENCLNTVKNAVN